MKRSSLLAGLAAGAVGLALAGAAPSAAAPEARTVAKDLLSPLSVAVADSGAVYFSENFKGTLLRRADGRTRTVHRAPAGTEVGAVSVAGKVVTFATTDPAGNTVLMRKEGAKKARKVVSLSAFEKARNPDRKVAYGIPGLDAECAAQFPEDGPPASYTGIVESHPYATLSVRGATYVADAAANAVFKVVGRKIRTAVVLPPVPFAITPAAAESTGLPECAIGKRYLFESVPTDVELGPDGHLYVTALPGGPEDPSLGARGALFRVDPKSGKVRRVVSGLMSPTGLAVSPRGDFYVAELFGMRIAKVKKGSTTVRRFAEAPLPGDVEWSRRGLYATTNVLTGLSGEPGDVPAGRVVRLTN